ncbi:MAG: ABC transporter substrate-binding protein [Clostridia bacterium]|jgi:NitT/TauT family transport system substrate-binding protein|nr:ABC transporter substrate-binding protein [Clostridia bacterium]
MKKLIVLLLVSALLFVAGCSSTAKNSPQVTPPEAPPEVNIRIGGLKGPTSMGLVHLMQAAEEGKAANSYAFTISGSADEVTPKLIQGELDIAAVPANLSSVLYNNTKGDLKLLAVNTLGVMYVVETGNNITSIKDLRGKTIYSTGKGSTPEYTLRYLLSQNGIDPDKDVIIEWKSEPTETVALLSQGKDQIAMLPQPYVAVAQSKLANLRIAIDMNKAWEDLNKESQMITGVLIVRNDFAKNHPQQLAAFLDEYKISTEFINANVTEGAKLVEKFGIVPAAVAEKAIPYCNITYLVGNEMKTAMEGYLNVLFEQNPKSIGGSLPGDDFYYQR